MSKILFHVSLFLTILGTRTASAVDYDLFNMKDCISDTTIAASDDNWVDPLGLKSFVDQNVNATPEITQPTSGVNPVGLKSFPSNLGRNFIAIFSKQALEAAMAGSILTVAAHGFDDSIRKYYAGRQTVSTGEKIADVLGGPEFMVPAVTTMLLLGHHMQNTKFKAMTYSLAQGYVLTVGLTYAIKVAVNRDRPNGNPRSFVSGHASSSFLWASVLGHYYGKKVYLPVYGIAILIATSRVSDNVHWLSDVVGGATLGFIVGNVVSNRIDRLMRPSKYAFAPLITRDGGGLAVMINF